MASVESFTTYYASCSACRWDGPDRESERDAADDDAKAHECAPGEPSDWTAAQKAWDHS